MVWIMLSRTENLSTPSTHDHLFSNHGKQTLNVYCVYACGNRLILVRAAVELEPTTGTLRVRWEDPGLDTAHHAHTHYSTQLHLGQFRIVYQPANL